MLGGHRFPFFRIWRRTLCFKIGESASKTCRATQTRRKNGCSDASISIFEKICLFTKIDDKSSSIICPSLCIFVSLKRFRFRDGCDRVDTLEEDLVEVFCIPLPASEFGRDLESSVQPSTWESESFTAFLFATTFNNASIISPPGSLYNRLTTRNSRIGKGTGAVISSSLPEPLEGGVSELLTPDPNRINNGSEKVTCA